MTHTTTDGPDWDQHEPTEGFIYGFWSGVIFAGLIALVIWAAMNGFDHISISVGIH